MSAWTIFWIIVLLLVLYAVKKNLPDIIRYWRIRSM
ncbi:MAG: DUF6893 family small protein [Chromatiales bacterium]